MKSLEITILALLVIGGIFTIVDYHIFVWRCKNNRDFAKKVLDYDDYKILWPR